jgi:hypothetical protein
VHGVGSADSRCRGGGLPHRMRGHFSQPRLLDRILVGSRPRAKDFRTRRREGGSQRRLLLPCCRHDLPDRPDAQLASLRRGSFQSRIGEEVAPSKPQAASHRAARTAPTPAWRNHRQHQRAQRSAHPTSIGVARRAQGSFRNTGPCDAPPSRLHAQPPTKRGHPLDERGRAHDLPSALRLHGRSGD